MMNLIFTHDNIECKIFKTILYRNGVKIYLSDNRVNRYVRLDSIYFGLSDDNLIVEICICEMNAYELNHLKNELKQAT